MMTSLPGEMPHYKGLNRKSYSLSNAIENVNGQADQVDDPTSNSLMGGVICYGSPDTCASSPNNVGNVNEQSNQADGLTNNFDESIPSYNVWNIDVQADQAFHSLPFLISPFNNPFSSNDFLNVNVQADQVVHSLPSSISPVTNPSLSNVFWNADVQADQEVAVDGPNQVTNCPSLICQWQGKDGMQCLIPINCKDVPAHFKEHGIVKMRRGVIIACQWLGCRESVIRHNFVRHIREAHFHYGRNVNHVG